MNLVEFIPSCLLVVLLGVLLRRRAYAALPCFFSCAAFSVSAEVWRFGTHSHYPTCRQTNWITEAGYDPPGIFVIYELLRAVLGTRTPPGSCPRSFPAG